MKKFHFKGRGFLRPAWRGICIGPELKHLEEEIEEALFPQEGSGGAGAYIDIVVTAAVIEGQTDEPAMSEPTLYEEQEQEIIRLKAELKKIRDRNPPHWCTEIARAALKEEKTNLELMAIIVEGKQ